MEPTKTTERLQALLPKIFERETVAGERYLLFEIIPEMTAAIPLSQVWEATVLSASLITPIPLMPRWVLGWSNGRDRVFSVIDLADFLAIEQSAKSSQQYSTLVIQIAASEKDFSLLGIVVHRILRTVTFTEEMIASVGEFTPAPYLKGYLQQNEQQIAVLDLENIIHQLQQKG